MPETNNPTTASVPEDVMRMFEALHPRASTTDTAQTTRPASTPPEAPTASTTPSAQPTPGVWLPAERPRASVLPFVVMAVALTVAVGICFIPVRQERAADRAGGDDPELASMEESRPRSRKPAPPAANPPVEQPAASKPAPAQPTVAPRPLIAPSRPTRDQNWSETQERTFAGWAKDPSDRKALMYFIKECDRRGDAEMTRLARRALHTRYP